MNPDDREVRVRLSKSKYMWPVLSVMQENDLTHLVEELLEQSADNDYRTWFTLTVSEWKEIATVLEKKEKDIHGQSHPFWSCRKVRERIEDDIEHAKSR